MRKIKMWLPAAIVAGGATLANAAGNFAATDSVTTAMTSLASDVSGEITPKAIALVIGVALLIASRQLIKKFFKI